MLELFTMVDNVIGIPHPENGISAIDGDGWMLYINLDRDDRSYRREPMYLLEINSEFGSR
jgi:hypothetical protein